LEREPGKRKNDSSLMETKGRSGKWGRKKDPKKKREEEKREHLNLGRGRVGC